MAKKHYTMVGLTISSPASGRILDVRAEASPGRDLPLTNGGSLRTGAKSLGNARRTGRQNERGFTLIEIMIVVVIIGVLATMVVPRLTGRTEGARRAAAEADIKANISVALDLYELDNGRFPSTEQGLDALLKKPSANPEPPNWNGPYLKGGVPKDPWGQPYHYVFPGQNNERGYDLSTYGPDGAEGGDDDIVNWVSATAAEN